VTALTLRALRAAWRFVREWSGDSAYERYLERTQPEARLGRQAFYLDALERRYQGPSRCC
jgi:hypothetical protein